MTKQYLAMSQHCANISPILFAINYNRWHSRKLWFICMCLYGSVERVPLWLYICVCGTRRDYFKLFRRKIRFYFSCHKSIDCAVIERLKPLTLNQINWIAVVISACHRFAWSNRLQHVYSILFSSYLQSSVLFVVRRQYLRGHIS